MWPDILRELVGRAAISEEHRMLMGMVMERISSAESGLHEAFMSLLTSFEVCEIICDSTPHVIVAPETLVVVENGGDKRIIFPGNNQTAFMCRWWELRWLAGLGSLPN